jgi:hypothetical protein
LEEIMGDPPVIVIVDDEAWKMGDAESAVHAVFPGADIRLMLVQATDIRSDAELAWDIMKLGPRILILDNEFKTARKRRPDGSTIALMLRHLPGGKEVLVVMHSKGWEGSELEAMMLMGTRRTADYGASPSKLREVLERLKAEKFPGS